MLVWVLLACVIALLCYIRFAPSDAKRWHVSLSDVQDKDFKGGATRIAPCDVAKLDEVAQKNGAKLLAGSVEEGHITYVDRTKMIGFPDYITVQDVNGKTAVYGRLRFGRSDLGVNKKRIEGWFSQL